MLPDRDLQNILAWHTQNPSFEIWIWIDQQNQAVAINVRAYLEKAINRVAATIQPSVDLTKIVFKDIQEPAQSATSDIIQYEQQRLRPDYGACSDQIRLRVLKYGGFYGDTDVLPTSRSLESSGIFDAVYTCHQFFVDPNGQNQGALGNDAFISTPNNPILDLLLHIIAMNYVTVDTGFQVSSEDFPVAAINKEGVNSLFPMFNTGSRQVMNYDSSSFRDPGFEFYRKGYTENITPRKTGWGPIQSVISPEMVGQTHRYTVRGKIHSLFIGSISPFTHCRCNHRGWIEQPLIGGLRQDAILAKVIMTIKFEAELGFIRLDDHIDNILTLIQQTTESVVTLLFHALRQVVLDTSKIKAAQLTLKYPETYQYYCEIGIPLSSTFLIPNLSEETPSVNSTEILEGLLSDEAQRQPNNILFWLFNLISKFQKNHPAFVAKGSAHLKQYSDCVKILEEFVAIHGGSATVKLNRMLNALHNDTLTMEREVIPITYDSSPQSEPLSIDLSNWGLTDDNVAALLQRKLEHLSPGLLIVSINLSNNNLTDASIPAIISILQARTVKSLSLFRNNIRTSVEPLLNLPIKALDLRDNHLTLQAMRSLNLASSHISINFDRRIIMTNANIDDNLLSTLLIPIMRDIGNITLLDLSFNPITDVGKESLASLNAEQLIVDNTLVDIAAEHIVAQP